MSGIQVPAVDESAVKQKRDLVRECDRCYRLAFNQVQAFSEYADLALQYWPDYVPELSAAFRQKDRELTDEIRTIWHSDRPDLERFKDLSNQWVDACLQELRRWVDEANGRRGVAVS